MVEEEEANDSVDSIRLLDCSVVVVWMIVVLMVV